MLFLDSWDNTLGLKDSVCYQLNVKLPEAKSGHILYMNEKEKIGLCVIGFICKIIGKESLIIIYLSLFFHLHKYICCFSAKASNFIQ